MADTVNVTTNLDDSYDVETEIMNTPASANTRTSKRTASASTSQKIKGKKSSKKQPSSQKKSDKSKPSLNCAQSDFSGFIKQLLQDTDFTKLLQNCVAKIVANTIVEVKEHLSKRILETENRLENHDGILLTMQNSLDEKAQEVKALSKSVSEMKDHIDAMQNTLHDAEQHNRRNSIRLYGVPEAVGENTDRAVIQALNSNLPCSLSPDDIESSHRSGKPRVSGPGNKTS